MATSTTTISVFVTTYGVANEQGFAHGKWFDLSDYAYKDEFIEAAIEYAKEELGDADPELCFSDIEYEDDIFECLVSESGINEHLWSYLDLSDIDLEVVSAYAGISSGVNLRVQDAHEILQEAEECYQGHYDSDRDFTEELLHSTGELRGISDWVLGAIDFDRLAKDLMMDYASENGHYFRTT